MILINELSTSSEKISIDSLIENETSIAEGVKFGYRGMSRLIALSGQSRFYCMEENDF